MAWLAIADHICTGISHYRDALYAYSFNTSLSTLFPTISQTTFSPPSSSPALSQSTTPTLISPSSLSTSPYLPLRQEQSFEPSQRQQYPVYSPTLVPAPSLPKEYAQEPRITRSSTAARPALPSILAIQPYYSIPSYPTLGVVPLSSNDSIVRVYIRTALPNNRLPPLWPCQ